MHAQVEHTETVSFVHIPGSVSEEFVNEKPGSQGSACDEGIPAGVRIVFVGHAGSQGKKRPATPEDIEVVGDWFTPALGMIRAECADIGERKVALIENHEPILGYEPNYFALIPGFVVGDAVHQALPFVEFSGFGRAKALHLQHNLAGKRGTEGEQYEAEQEAYHGNFF